MRFGGALAPRVALDFKSAALLSASQNLNNLIPPETTEQ